MPIISIVFESFAMCYSGNNTSNDRKRDDGSTDHAKCSSQSGRGSPAPTPAQGATGTETRPQVGSYNNTSCPLYVQSMVLKFYIGEVFGWWK